MGKAAMYLPCGIECDGCGTEAELAYKVDLAAASRARSMFKPAWFRQVRQEVEEAARAEGWAVSAAGSYCPECADKLEAGSIRPADTVSARGLIADMALIVKTRPGRNGKEG